MVLIRTPTNQTIIVKPHVQALANALHKEFGIDSFGTYLNHSWPEGPTQAIDIFTPDNPDGWALQDEICAYIRKNVKRFGGRYHIRRHQIWNIERADEGYRNQSVTGNRTIDHMDHVHDTQYEWAPGPFDTVIVIPQKPTTLYGEDMLVFNVEGTGIFMSRGDVVQHLQSPAHVLEFVGIGVPYQDKKELSREVASAYLGISIQGLMGLVAPSTMPYDEMLAEVEEGLKQIREEYFRMMEVS